MPNPETIDVDQVDVSSTDPNIKGVRGSVFAASTDAEHDWYVNQLDSGIPEPVAYDNLARTIAERFARATGPYVVVER